mgnify:CR=1 FL=1|tara:strand:+ start:1012 stop:2031 length:1020 start_codon:yes stop_codon:yes gene_type:complete
METGEHKMTNLLLEDFINEINEKRQPIIQEYFDSRMENVNQIISNIPKKFNDWDNDAPENCKCELTEDGFITDVYRHDGTKRQNRFDNKFTNETLNLIFNHKWIHLKNLKGIAGFKMYSDDTKYEYTLKNIEDIKKVVLANTTTEINNVFDMYLSRVTSTVKQIDYCSKVISCITKTFSINGYPNSTLDIKTENGSSCQIKTTLKWNTSKFGLVFGQYPTTIHNVAREGSEKKGHIFEVASDNFNEVWSVFEAHEKNDKTFAKIAKLKAELAAYEMMFTKRQEKAFETYQAKPSLFANDTKNVQNKTKQVNKRIEKLNSEIIDVKSFRDIGQSLIKEVA